MKAGALAFRFRLVIFVLLYLFGFLPPWDFARGSRTTTLWLTASTLLARTGWVSLGAATLGVTMAALACLLAAAALRVWGTAYLGSGIMRDGALHGERLMAAGPYRYLRNPLYLGAWLLAFGTSFLMPADGAAFFLPAFTVFVLFLIRTEEGFLLAKLGESYKHYYLLVPRWLPRVTAGLPASPVRPQWMQAVLAETYPIAFSLCFAVLAWRYNAHILIQSLLICYGASLVVRALMKRPAGA